MSIEIEEENKLVLLDDIFDVSQSGVMPFWLKVRVQSHLPPLATLLRAPYYGSSRHPAEPYGCCSM